MSEVVRLFQYSTLSALMSGLYGRTLTIGEFLEHGDLGIRTLDSIDGELIILDDKAYQAKGSERRAEVVGVSDDVKIPYIAIIPHQTGMIFKQRFAVTDKGLKKRIESYHSGVNLSRSIKIKRIFAKIYVRMIPKPALDIRFADVAAHQPEYTRENIPDTTVGIWTPQTFHGASSAGYYLHSISDGFTFGGHITDSVISEGAVEAGPVDQFDQRFPVQDRKYLSAKFNMDELKEDITGSE